MENKLCLCGKPAAFLNRVRAFCEPCRQGAIDNWNRECRRINAAINPKEYVHNRKRGR